MRPFLIDDPSQFRPGSSPALDSPRYLLTLTIASAPGVVQADATFEAIALAVVDARVWGGIHWRTSCDRGLAAGQEIGRYAVPHFLTPGRHGG